MRVLAQQAAMSSVNQPQAASVQRRLKIGPVDDPLEHEADKVAETVMRMPADGAKVTRGPVQISRKCDACDDELMIRRQAAESPPVPAGANLAGIERALASAGRPLEPEIRAYFEPRFGNDFSDVRVHTGLHAAESAASVGASAYTIGQDVVFGSGRYAPGTEAGRRLLAHELVHTVQQRTKPVLLQRACDCGGVCPKCRPAGSNGPQGTSTPSVVKDVLRSPGRPLDAATRAFFEPRFGRDFSQVRIHTDAPSGQAARLIGADAYTVGDHIAFAPGLFAPGSSAGRDLLAHELAHSMQYRGRIDAGHADVVSRAGDPAEQAAAVAAEAAIAGRPVPRLASVAPMVFRQPAKPARRGFSIQVVVNEPVDGHEFCIRAVMQGHAIGRREAEYLLDTGALHCYGREATHGVNSEWVGHPIPFWVGDSLATGSEDTGNEADVKINPDEKEEIDAEVNQRFWSRIGDIRLLSKDDPKDAAYREVWKAERAAVWRERHPAYDPFSSELRQFAAIARLPAGGEAQDYASDMVWMMQVQDLLAGLSERDWMRLRRVGVPQRDWQGLAAWLSRFVAQQRADEAVITKVSELDRIGEDNSAYGKESAYEMVHGMGLRAEGAFGGQAIGGVWDPVVAEAHGRGKELEQAAGDFRAAFRTRAFEIARQMLGYVRFTMVHERSLMQFPKEREALFAALSAGSKMPPEILEDHPILSRPDVLEQARNPRTPIDLGEWLRGEAYRQIERIDFVSEHLDEKPDVVFGFDVVVAATLAELGLEQSVHALIIRRGWGKSDGSSLFDKLLDFGLIVLSFVPVIGPVIGAVEGFRAFDKAVTSYGVDKYAFGFGMRTTMPSKSGIAWGAVGLAGGVLPLGHELSGTARSLGRIERAAATEAGTTGRAGAATARSGEEVAAARAGGEVGEAAVVRGPDPIKSVREPVKGGHHVEVSNRGIEYCSPDPCPLLRVEYARELQANDELAQRLKVIEDLRATDPAQAARAAGQIRESLEYVRGHAELFAGLPPHVSPAMKARLAGLLESAEGAGVRLGREQLNEISDALRVTKGTKAAGEILDSIGDNLSAHVELRQSFGAAGEIGGGSRPGDLATKLPEGTQALNPATRYPKEVSAFLQRHPKVHASPQSEAALDALYGHTKSGALSVTTRAGRYVPTETRAAAAEIESIEELAARPEVERIELIPSSSEGRTVDKIVDIRQPDGTVVRSRWEDRTITGAPINYQPRGGTGWSVASADRIESAVRGKVTSTATKPSQFDALMVEAPTGGTLAVHVLNPGPSGSQIVAAAMANLAGDLGRSSVRAIEFFLPRQLLRYVRQQDGTFILVSDRITVP